MILDRNKLQELNRYMLGLGAPVERDNVGYNKPDFGLMEGLARFIPSLDDKMAYAVAERLSHYKTTQLSDMKEDLEETVNYYRELTKMDKPVNYRNICDSYEASDFVPYEAHLFMETESSAILTFDSKLFLQNVNIPYWAEIHWVDNNYSKLEVPKTRLEDFLERIKDYGKYGYAPDADVQALVEKIKNNRELLDKSRDNNMKLVGKTEDNSTYYVRFTSFADIKEFMEKENIISPGCLKWKKIKENIVLAVNRDEMFYLYDEVKKLGFYNAQLEEKSKEVKLLSDDERMAKANTELLKGNVSGNHLVDIGKFTLPFTPYDFQMEDATRIVENKSMLIGHDMGCVSGKSKVRIKEQGKAATRNVYVGNLFKLIQKDPTIQVKCLVNGRFAYMPIKAVLDKGIQETVRIETGETFIECTKDHEILTENGWVEAGDLNIGDTVFTNGKQETCICCGGTENLITDRYAKWRGYCKECMYKMKPNGNQGVIRKLDKNGYVRLIGNGTKDMPDYAKMTNQGGIYEHHQVWYENTGHVVQDGEVVHHKDLNKQNNSFDNLQLMTDAEHKLLHADMNTKSLPQFNERLDYIVKNGKKIYYVPQKQVIRDIEPAGNQKVYDIAIDSNEIHNFICNDIVVHNCGKTFIATLVGTSLDMPKLVVVPESLRLNWRKEIKNVTPDASIRVLYSKDKFDIEKDNMPDWTIVGYKTVTKYAEQLKALGYQCVFVDEAHNCKAVNNRGEAASQRAKAVLDLCESASYVYPMTGTPIPTRNKDLFNILKMLKMEKAGEVDLTGKWGFYKYATRYCDAHNNGFGWECEGNSNSAELNMVLKPYMVRRLKSDVLPNLTKQRLFIPTETTSREYKDIEKRLHHMQDGDTYMGLAMTGRNVLSKEKVKPAIDLAESILEEGKSVVLVSNFNETLDTIMERFGDDCCSIRGGMSDIQKQKAIDDFQSGKKHVCALNIIAGGVGVTLTKAHDMVIVDYDWTPANMSQVEDRICRAGQTEGCNIHYIYCENSLLDITFVDMITSKSSNIDRVVDGTENTMDLKEGVSFMKKLQEAVEKDKMGQFAETMVEPISKKHTITPAEDRGYIIDDIFLSNEDILSCLDYKKTTTIIKKIEELMATKESRADLVASIEDPFADVDLGEPAEEQSDYDEER